MDISLPVRGFVKRSHVLTKFCVSFELRSQYSQVNTDMFKTYLPIFCYWKLRWMRRRKHGVGESFSWEEGRSQPCGQKLVPAGSLLRWPTVKHLPILMLDTLLGCRTPFWTVRHPVLMSDTLLDCRTTCSPVKHPACLTLLNPLLLGNAHNARSLLPQANSLSSTVKH